MIANIDGKTAWVKKQLLNSNYPTVNSSNVEGKTDTPKIEIVVIEIFDFNCPNSQKASGIIGSLIGNNYKPKLNYINVECIFLNEEYNLDSKYTADAGLSVYKGLGPKNYFTYWNTAWGVLTEGPVTIDSIMVSLKRWETDIYNYLSKTDYKTVENKKLISDTNSLSGQLGLLATPSFIIIPIKEKISPDEVIYSTLTGKCYRSN